METRRETQGETQGETQNRNRPAHLGGYNVTGELINYEIANNVNDHPSQSAPGLPYKLRRRMTGEEIKTKCSTMDYLLCALGVLLFAAMCIYGGVQYGR